MRITWHSDYVWVFVAKLIWKRREMKPRGLLNWKITCFFLSPAFLVCLTWQLPINCSVYTSLMRREVIFKTRKCICTNESFNSRKNCVTNISTRHLRLNVWPSAPSPGSMRKSRPCARHRDATRKSCDTRPSLYPVLKCPHTLRNELLSSFFSFNGVTETEKSAVWFRYVPLEVWACISVSDYWVSGSEPCYCQLP